MGRIDDLLNEAREDYLAPRTRGRDSTATSRIDELLGIDPGEPPPAPPPDDFRDVSAEDPEEEYQRRKRERAEREANFNWSSVDSQNVEHLPNKPGDKGWVAKAGEYGAKALETVWNPPLEAAASIGEDIGSAVGEGRWGDAWKSVVTAPITAPKRIIESLAGGAEKREETLAGQWQRASAENPDETGWDVNVSRALKNAAGELGVGVVETVGGVVSALDIGSPQSVVDLTWDDAATQEFIDSLGGKEGLARIVYEDFANPLNVLVNATLGDLVEANAKVAKAVARVAVRRGFKDFDVVASMVKRTPIPSEARVAKVIDDVTRLTGEVRATNIDKALRAKDTTQPFTTAEELATAGKAKKGQLFPVKEEVSNPESPAPSKPYGSFDDKRRYTSTEIDATLKAIQERKAELRKTDADWRKDGEYQRLYKLLVAAEDKATAARLGRHTGGIPNPESPTTPYEDEVALINKQIADIDQRRRPLVEELERRKAKGLLTEDWDEPIKQLDAEENALFAKWNRLSTEAAQFRKEADRADVVSFIAGPVNRVVSRVKGGLIQHEGYVAGGYSGLTDIYLSPDRWVKPARGAAYKEGIHTTHSVARTAIHEVFHRLAQKSLDKYFIVSRMLSRLNSQNPIPRFADIFREIADAADKGKINIDWATVRDTIDLHIDLSLTRGQRQLAALKDIVHDETRRTYKLLSDAYKNTKYMDATGDIVDAWGHPYGTGIRGSDPLTWSEHNSEITRAAAEQVLLNVDPKFVDKLTADPVVKARLYEMADTFYLADKAEGFPILKEAGADLGRVTTAFETRQLELKYNKVPGYAIDDVDLPFSDTMLADARVELKFANWTLIDELESGGTERMVGITGNSVQEPYSSPRNVDTSTPPASLPPGPASPATQPLPPNYAPLVEFLGTIGRLTASIEKAGEWGAKILPVPMNKPAILSRGEWEKTWLGYKTAWNHLKTFPTAIAEARKILGDRNNTTFTRLQQALTVAHAPLSNFVKDLAVVTYNAVNPYIFKDVFTRAERVTGLKNAEKYIEAKTIRGLIMAEHVNRLFGLLPDNLKYIVHRAMRNEEVMAFYREKDYIPIAERGFQDFTAEFIDRTGIDPAQVSSDVWSKHISQMNKTFDLLVSSHDALVTFRKVEGLPDLPRPENMRKDSPALRLKNYDIQEEFARFNAVGWEDELLKIDTGGTVDTPLTARSKIVTKPSTGQVRDPIHVMSRMWEDTVHDYLDTLAQKMVLSDKRLVGKFTTDPAPAGWVPIGDKKGPLTDKGYTHIHPDANKILIGNQPFQKNIITAITGFVAYGPRLARTALSAVNQLGNRIYAMYMWFAEMNASMLDPVSLKRFFSDYHSMAKQMKEADTIPWESIPSTPGSYKRFDELGGTRFHKEGDPLFEGLHSKLEKQAMQSLGAEPKKTLFQRKLPRVHKFIEYAKELYMRPDRIGAAAIFKGLVEQGVPELVAVERARSAIIDTAKTGTLWQFMTHSGLALFAGWRMEAIPVMMKQWLRSPSSALNGVLIGSIASIVTSAALGSSPFNPFGEEKDRARQFLPTKLQPTGIEAIGADGGRTKYAQFGDMFNPYTIPYDFLTGGWAGVMRTVRSGPYGQFAQIIDNKDANGRPIYDEALMLTPKGQWIARLHLAGRIGDWAAGPTWKSAKTAAQDWYIGKDRFGNETRNMATVHKTMLDTILGIKIYDIDVKKTRTKNLADITGIINMLKDRNHKLQKKDGYYLRMQGISEDDIPELMQENTEEIKNLTKRANELRRQPLPGQR